MLDEIQQSTSSSCSQFFITEKLNKMRCDSDFISRMHVLLATRTRQELFSNTAAKHLELGDLTRPLERLTHLCRLHGLPAILSTPFSWCIRGGHVQPTQRAFHPNFHRESTHVSIEDGASESKKE